jgi:type II secretory pathway pseudopilin PulG
MVGPKNREAGFSLLEILIGFAAISFVLIGLSLFLRGQVAGVRGSNDLGDATQVALTRLEVMKRTLADTAVFQSQYESAAAGTVKHELTRTMNHREYRILTEIDRPPEPLIGLRVRATVTWENGHSLELGLLVPGPTATL